MSVLGPGKDVLGFLWLLAERGARESKDRETHVAEPCLKLCHLREVLLGVAASRGCVHDERELETFHLLGESCGLELAVRHELLDRDIERIHLGVFFPCFLVGSLIFAFLACGRLGRRGGAASSLGALLGSGGPLPLGLVIGVSKVLINFRAFDFLGRLLLTGLSGLLSLLLGLLFLLALGGAFSFLFFSQNNRVDGLIFVGHRVPFCLGHAVPLTFLRFFFALILQLLPEFSLELEEVPCRILSFDFGLSWSSAIVLPFFFCTLLLPSGAGCCHLILSYELLTEHLLLVGKVSFLEGEVSAFAGRTPLHGHM